MKSFLDTTNFSLWELHKLKEFLDELIKYKKIKDNLKNYGFHVTYKNLDLDLKRTTLCIPTTFHTYVICSGDRNNDDVEAEYDYYEDDDFYGIFHQQLSTNFLKKAIHRIDDEDWSFSGFKDPGHAKGFIELNVYYEYSGKEGFYVDLEDKKKCYVNVLDGKYYIFHLIREEEEVDKEEEEEKEEVDKENSNDDEKESDENEDDNDCDDLITSSTKEVIDKKINLDDMFKLGRNTYVLIDIVDKLDDNFVPIVVSC
jgi:hypothetical protein